MEDSLLFRLSDSFLIAFALFQPPTCALQSPDGAKYCAILCTPSDSENLEGECGEMECMPIPQSGGFGICVYPLSLGLRASVESDLSFGITE